MTLRIGITGGIGSGKSTVARLFHALGVPIIDTDEIARQLVQPGQPALTRIIQAFGAGILAPSGELDRGALRAIVFAAPEKRRELEQILHPLIRAETAARARSQQEPYCLVVIPLLIETGWRDDVDRILVVDSPLELQLQRVTTRDHAAEADVRAIIDVQCAREARLAAADDVITNDGGLDRLRLQVERLHRRYLALASQGT